MLAPKARHAWLALLTVLLVAGSAAGVRVLESTDRLPDAVHAYGHAQVDDTTYLLGGGEGSGYTANITAVESNGASHHVGELPEPVKSPAAASHDGVVYVFGGATKSADNNVPTSRADILRFDPATGDVERLIDASLPEPVAGAQAVTVDGQIYVLGGLKIQPNQDPQIDWVSTIARFDPGTKEVTALDGQLPTGRAQASALEVGGDVLYFGGYAEHGGQACPDGSSACFVPDVLRYNVERDSVGQIGELETPVRWSAAALYQGTAYVLGGCQANCGPHEGTTAVQAVNASTGQARELPVTMPVTGGRNAASLHGAEAWLPGGVKATSQGSGDHSVILRLELGPTQPWAPSNLSAETTDEGIRLSWEPPAYDGGSEVTGYVIHRAEGAQQPQRLDRTTDTSFHDDSARSGSSYTYRVVAENRHGLSAPSGEVLAQASSVPSAPAVSAQGGNEKIVVRWSPPEDTGGLNLTRYRVYAYPSNATPTLDGCGDSCWGEVPASTEEATITNVEGTAVENGNTYTVRVQVRNSQGWSDLSEPIEATPKPVPDAPGDLSATKRTDPRGVNLSWSAPEGTEVSGYTVYRGPALDALEAIATTDGTGFADEGDLPEGSEIVYAVAARNGDAEGPISQPARVVFAKAPGPVTELTATWTGSQVQVAWSSPNDTGGRPIQAYEVARTRGAGEEPNASETQIHRTAVTRFTDDNPPRGSRLAYHVRAVTGAGEGPWDFGSVLVPLAQDSAPPVAVLAAHPKNVDAGERVVFDASGSEDDDGVVAYNFDFGDNTTTGWRSSPRITHSYSSADVYDAQVTVRDVTGQEATAQATIAVGDPPPDSDGDGVPDGQDNCPSTPNAEQIDTDSDGTGQACQETSQNGSPLGLGAGLLALGGAALAARGRD